MKIMDIAALKTAKTIAISGHVRPDGDCVGSVMGLYLYLKKVIPEAEVKVFLEQPPEIFRCIKDFDVMDSTFSSQTKYDVYFALDCNDERLGPALPMYLNAATKVNIDHHVSNQGCGDINIVEPDRSSTSELVYDMMDTSAVDTDIAQAIYIGIIHDTGVLKYSCTTPRTLQVAAELIAYGFDFSKLIEETFYEKTYAQTKIMGKAVLDSELLMEGKCLAGMVSRELMQEFLVGTKDFDGIVNQLIAVKGVECALFAYETGDMEYKFSMRSKGNVDVASVAVIFGGGGHVRAAGCTMQGSYGECLEQLLAEIAKQL